MQSGLQWILVAVLAVAAVVWVALPLRRSMANDEAFALGNGNRRGELLKKKDQAYAELKEIEFDYKVGKLSEEDYQQLTKRQRAVALSVLEQLEALEEPDDLDRYIDAEIARRLAERKAVQSAHEQPDKPGAASVAETVSSPTLGPALGRPQPDASTDVLSRPAAAGETAETPMAPRARPAEPSGESAPAAAAVDCQRCGARMQQGAHFCSQCGAAVSRRCAACNQPLGQGDKFCFQCGAAVR